MDAKAKWSIANLKTPCVEPDYLIQLNGITWPVDPQFDRHIASFLNRRAKPCENGRIDRYGFELFLQSQKLLSRNYSAARLGMTPESLDMLIPRLPELGLSKKYKVYEGIYEASMRDDLVSTLPGLRFRTFGTHDFFCEFLHGGLRYSKVRSWRNRRSVAAACWSEMWPPRWRRMTADVTLTSVMRARSIR